MIRRHHNRLTGVLSGTLASLSAHAFDLDPLVEKRELLEQGGSGHSGGTRQRGGRMEEECQGGERGQGSGYHACQSVVMSSDHRASLDGGCRIGRGACLHSWLRYQAMPFWLIDKLLALVPEALFQHPDVFWLEHWLSEFRN